jgi:hypothetical protein
MPIALNVSVNQTAANNQVFCNFVSYLTVQRRHDMLPERTGGRRTTRMP